MAITKKRLHELIKQKGMIYWITNRRVRLVFDLSLAKIQIRDLDCVIDYPLLNNSIWCIPYKELTDSKDDVDWYQEFGKVEITKELVLPTWEEVENMNKFIVCEIDDWYRLMVHFPQEIDETGFIGIDAGGNCEIYHWDGANKENYTLACRQFVKIFKGERDD